MMKGSSRSLIAADEDQCANKVALTGHLVTKTQAELKKPGWLKVFASDWMAEHLQLGSDTATQRAQTMSEQTNLGLMSALILTITYPYFLDLQDQDFSGFGPRAEAYSGILHIASLISSGGFLISVIHAVLTICALGETTGSIEATMFASRMGLLNLSSFYSFQLGVFAMAVVLIFHLVIFAPGVWVIVGAIVPVALFLVFFWLPVHYYQTKSLYEVKVNSYANQPIVLTMKEVDEYLQEFCSKVGADYLAPDTMVRYIELKHKSTSKYVPTVLAERTKARVRLLAERLCEQLDIAACKASVAYKDAKVLPPELHEKFVAQWDKDK